MKKEIVFRIDDIGASTKHFNQYGKKIFRFLGVPYFYFPIANIGFFKRVWPFRGWAKYNEVSKEEWSDFLDIFEYYNITPIISVTACWVEHDGTYVEFPDKFPKQAQFLKDAFLKGKITIANHGLTHCVVGKHTPRFWSSNKTFHREFWHWLPQQMHDEHIQRSQNILEDFFEKSIHIFVPPGNVWSRKTYNALKNTNIKKIISKNYMIDSNESMDGIEFIDDTKGFFNFHDRELKLYGREWLIQKIKEKI
ncbi:hypothetical protein COB64_00495 [Candidatus Wolfebacteria bacterium]|nr:MAG: hypothetical protein COB64_00495 [Candidatus Wolfebacteria bacterium]